MAFSSINASAKRNNHKCKGLEVNEEVVFCNPPYAKAGRQDAWVKKGWEESRKENTTVVMLLPARTDTRRFHQYILGKAEVRFIQGRISF